MEYTIRQVSEKCALTAHTLRYYEKEGLLPFVGRDHKGHRIFSDHDIEWVKLICCLRDTKMSISEIKRYVKLYLKGDETIESRKQILLQHKYALSRR